MKLYYNEHLKELAKELRNDPTHAEKSLWYALRGKQVKGYDFHRQKPLGNFIYDFYSYALKLVIEVDGISHETDEVKQNDKVKDEYIRSVGFNILRFTDEEVLGNPNKVVSEIEEYIAEFERHTP
ncbi:endonuclease domain-containing protein [Bacteroidota bacterium]